MKEYWIVDLEVEKVEVWPLEETVFVLSGTYSKNDRVKSPLFSGLAIALSEVFQENEGIIQSGLPCLPLIPFKPGPSQFLLYILF